MNSSDKLRQMILEWEMKDLGKVLVSHSKEFHSTTAAMLEKFYRTFEGTASPSYPEEESSQGIRKMYESCARVVLLYDNPLEVLLSKEEELDELSRRFGLDSFSSMGVAVAKEKFSRSVPARDRLVDFLKTMPYAKIVDTPYAAVDLGVQNTFSHPILFNTYKEILFEAALSTKWISMMTGESTGLQGLPNNWEESVKEQQVHHTLSLVIKRVAEYQVARIYKK